MAKRSLSSFYAACSFETVDVVENYLKTGFDVNVCFEARGGSHILHLLAMNNEPRSEIIKLLLQYGADPNKPDSHGTSPLHIVCRENKEKFDFIFSKSSFVWYAKDTRKYVEYSRDLEMAQLLIEFGGDVNARNSSGDTPLSYVLGVDNLRKIEEIFIANHNYEIVTKRIFIKGFRMRQKNKIDFLLSKGADVGIVYNNGDTILHLAIKGVKESRQVPFIEAMPIDDEILAQIVKQILKRGADVNAKNNEGQTPLQLAVALLCSKTVKILLNYNADVTDIKFEGFHYSADIIPCLQATNNLVNIVDALSNKGAYLNNLKVLKFFVSNNSEYPFSISDDKEIKYKIKNLLECGADHNIRVCLDKFSNNVPTDDSETKTEILKCILDYVTILKRGNLYASQEIVAFLRSKMTTVDPKYGSIDRDELIHQEAKHEIDRMKVTKLGAHTSLYDIMSTDPRRCYCRLKRCDYMSVVNGHNCRETFFFTLGVIKGHIAKILVRRYVVESARDYLATLINLRLPDLCCDLIFDYLSNESLFNLCLAAS